MALNFSKNAFVERDFERAYSYFPSNTAQEFNVSKLKELVENMHPSGKYPIEIRTEDYEIVPNSGIIRIYLQGKGQNGEIHYYRVATVLENNDYKVGEIYRKEPPHPKTSPRQPVN